MTIQHCIVGVLILLLAACSDEPTWSEQEKTNARYITLAFGESQQAIRISNSQPAVSAISKEDREGMTMHYQTARQYAETVTDEVLDKVHSEMRAHWRNEFQEGIRLRLINLQHGDLEAEIKGSALLDRFGDWWNANKNDLRVPK